MRVICIKQGDWISSLLNRKTINSPSYMEECTAYDYNAESYTLVEYPCNDIGHPATWNKKWFTPLSEIDETTFERNYKKELV